MGTSRALWDVERAWGTEIASLRVDRLMLFDLVVTLSSSGAHTAVAIDSFRTYHYGSERAKVGGGRTAAIAGLIAVASIAAISTGEPTAGVGTHVATTGNCVTNRQFRFGFTGPFWVQGNVDHRYGAGGGRNARANVLAWNALRGENGAELVRLFEAAGGVWVRIEEPPNANAWGTANCGTQLIRINPSILHNNARFRTTLQHEIGHTMGLSHSQAVPRDDGRYPLMSTCQSTARQEQRQLSQDDASALNFRNGGFRDLNPNPGFERNMYGWGAVGVQNFTTGGIPRSGNRAARWQNGFIETVAHVSAWSTRYHRGRAFVRNQTSSVQGGIRLEVWERRLNYQALSGTGCSNNTDTWNSNRNESHLASGGDGYAWVRRTTANGSGGFGFWTQVVTPTMTTHWNTVRLMLRVHNLAIGGPIIVDDPRLEWNV